MLSTVTLSTVTLSTVTLNTVTLNLIQGLSPTGLRVRPAMTGGLVQREFIGMNPESWTQNLEVQYEEKAKKRALPATHISIIDLFNKFLHNWSYQKLLIRPIIKSGRLSKEILFYLRNHLSSNHTFDNI